MADFINRETRQVVISKSTPDYPAPIWVKIPNETALSLSRVPPCFIVFDGDTPREMTQGEKDEYQSAHPAPARLIGRVELLSRIFAGAQSVEQGTRLRRVVRDYMDFVLFLDNYDYPRAIEVAREARTDGVITEEDLQHILGIIPAGGTPTVGGV